MARAEATAAAGSESELGPADGKLMDPGALERLKKFYRDMLLIRRFATRTRARMSSSISSKARPR